MREGVTARGRWWKVLRGRRTFNAYGYALANLLHRLHETILDPDFTETDITFLNQAVPQFFSQVSGAEDPTLIAMIVQLHDAVPEPQRPLITWHPNKSQRQCFEDRLGSM
jgi:hypothetical protein